MLTRFPVQTVVFLALGLLLAQVRVDASPVSSRTCSLRPLLAWITPDSVSDSRDGWAVRVAEAQALAHRYEDIVQGELRQEKPLSVTEARKRIEERRGLAADLRNALVMLLPGEERVATMKPADLVRRARQLRGNEPLSGPVGSSEPFLLAARSAERPARSATEPIRTARTPYVPPAPGFVALSHGPDSFKHRPPMKVESAKLSRSYKAVQTGQTYVPKPPALSGGRLVIDDPSVVYSHSYLGVEVPAPAQGELVIDLPETLRPSDAALERIPLKLKIPALSVHERLDAALPPGMTVDANTTYAGSGRYSEVFYVHPPMPEALRSAAPEARLVWLERYASEVVKIRRPILDDQWDPALNVDEVANALRSDVIVMDVVGQLAQRVTYEGKPLFEVVETTSSALEHQTGVLKSRVNKGVDGRDLAYAAACVHRGGCGERRWAEGVLRRAGFADARGRVTRDSARQALRKLGAFEKALQLLHGPMMTFREANDLSIPGLTPKPGTPGEPGAAYYEGIDTQRGPNFKYNPESGRFWLHDG